MADVEIQLLEQEKLIEQLKSMIRERDESFQQKEKELQDVNAKLSKLKLQAKAKVAKEAKEAKEGKGGKSGSTKKDTKDSLEEKEKGTAETEHDGTSRAKSLLLRKKLEDKDRVIREKDEEIQAKEQRVLAKEKIIAEREEIIESLTTQLQEKTNLMEEYQTSMDPSGNISETEERLNQMYAQIVYKDKNLLDLNNKMLEQERKMIDIQELVGEKNEVIRGRDKVIELLQSTIKEKDQNVHDQALLISRLTTKVEASDEIMGQLLEQVQKAEHNLKQERERFDLRLTESQKYFEETLKEQEEGVAKLQKAFQDKEAELLVSENDLRELLRRHEEDIQNIMSKGEVNIHDQVVQMLEQKLKDTNEVLEGKIKVIEVLQKESSQKDKEINESREVQKSLKDKLQVMSEQVMLFQANIADMESQWQEERRKHETKLNDLVEKHETELTEKDLKIQTLESSVSQLEAAYTQSSVQYNVLQDRYHSLLKPGGAVSVLKEQTADKTPVSVSMKEHESEEMECLKQKLDSLTLILKDKEQELTEMKEKIEEKEAELEKLKQSSEIEGTESKDLVEEISVLKNLLAELEEEKGSLQLKLVDFDEAKVLQGELQSKLADLKQQVEKVELEKAAADQSLILSCEERDELQKVVDDLQSDLDSTREILQQVQSELKSEKDLIGQLQGEKVSLEVRAAEAEEQREVVEREKADLQSLLESLRNKIESDMQQPLLDIERERDELKQKVSSLEEEAANQTHISKEIKEELNATAVQLRDKEAELSSLQAELASVKDQLDTHMQQIKELSVLKEDHLAQITGLQQELRTVKEDNMKTEERLQQSSEEYQSLIEQEQEKLKQTQSTYEETYKLLESAQTDHKEAKAVIEKQNTELSEKTAQLCMFKDSYFELKDKYENCQLCVQQQKEETDDLLSVFDISDLNLKGAKDLIISLQNELVTNKQELFDSHAKQTRLKQDLVQLETEHTEKMQIIHSQTGEEAEKWKESVAELNELITKKDECTEKLSLELEEVKRKLEESVLEVNQHKRQIDILKESQFSRGDEFQSRIQSLILQISDMEKLLSEKNNIIQEHCKKFETLNCELERITVESSSCKNEISHLKSNCDQKDKIVADLSYSYSQLEENMKELQSQCHNLQSENNDKDNKIQELTHTFSLSESSFREEQRKNSDLNCQVNIIESENFKLKEGITERDSAISKLLNRLNEDSQSRLLEEKQISYLKTSNEETIQCLKSLECEAENVKSELETTQMELNKIKNLCSEKDTAVKELNETVETITKENQELRSSSSETSASLISTQASLEEIAEKLKTSEAMLTTVQAENENLQKQAMIGDQSEALKENKTTIIGLEKERDEILEQLNVRKANYDSLITKYKSLEEEKQRLMSDCSNCGVELTNIKEALKHKTELIETLEKTVQDTKCQLDEILADKNSFQNKNSILENDNSFLSEEVRRLNSFAGEYSSMEESYKGTIANLTLQYELISAELETEREKVLNLNALKKCFEKEDRVETSKQGSDRAVNATTELDKIESVQNTNFIQNKLSSIDVVHEVETNKEEELNDVIKMQNQQICLLEREITNLKEAQISQIEWDDYDLRDICNKLEKEKQDLSAEIANQEKQIKKKDSQIKTLYRQLESLQEEQLQEGSKHANTNMQEPDFEPSNQLETEKNTTSEIHEPCITPSYGTDLQSVTSAGEMPGFSDTVSSDLGERLRKVTLERDKFKSDNKKLLKVGKGKDAKLDIMNKNFEKLRHERDSLLAERDSLENDLQDLRTSNFDSSYDKEVINSLMMRCKELEAVCAEKQLECSKVNQDINVTDRGDQAQLHIAVAGDIPQSNIFLEKSILSPANTLEQEQNMSGLSTADKSASQLKTDILKLQKVNKGKEAKVRKLEEKLLLQENEIRIHKEILSQKESDLSGLMEERIVFEKTRDEKIILDFELQCAKEELAKYRQIENTEYAEDKTKKDLPPAENEDDKDVFDISEFSPDIIRARIVTVLQENKKLKQENGKLQKLSKGKEAKVKKVEDLISQQQKLISDRETDILILKESVKDLTEKVTSLTEDENDLRYRLENAILDRDEWYDHCQDLEDQLDAAHESIDIKNEELLRLDETAMADRETIDSLLDEKESLEQEVLTLQNELDSSRNAIDKKDEQIINFETQLKSLAEEKEKLSAEIRKLHMVKKGKDAKAKKLEESVLVQENAMEAKEEVIEKLENRLQETEIQTQALENEVIDLKSEMQAQEKNKEVLQSKERELKSTLEELKCNLTIQSQQMKDLQDNNSVQAVTFQSQMSKMAADIHLSIARENELKEKIHNESRHRNELVKKIEESEQEIQQMKSLLIMKDEYISDIENKRMEVNSALHEKELLLLSTQETVNKLSSQIDDKDKEIMLLNNKITDNEQHLETLGNAADQQNVASYTLQEQLKNLSFAHVELKDILQKKEEELVSVSEKCEALKKQFESNMLLIQVKDDEINSARKKYLTLDEAAVIKQSLIEEKEKQLSTMSEELLKLKKIFEEKVTMIDNYERDIQDLTVEKVSLLQKSEMDSKELAATKEQILAEKLAVEQNLSWYIQYYETSNASMIALQEEQNNNAIQLKDMTARLAEQSECLEVAEESKLKAIQEKAQLQDEMQSQLNQALEKIALYDSDLKEKNRIEVSLRNELENLRCQHQKLEDETCQELSEKSRIISKLKSDLQESLNTKIKMNEEMNLQNMDISAVKEAVPADASNLIDESSLNNQETLPANKDNSNSISCQTEVQKLKKLCKAKDTKIKKLEDNLKHLSVANSDRASSVIHDYEHTDTDALKAHLKQIECLLTETQQEKEKLQIDANTFSQQSLSRQREIERLIGAQQEAAVLENSLQNQITHLQNLSDTLGKDLEKSRIVCDAVESDLLKVQAEYDDFKHHCQLNTDELKSELSNAYSQIANLNQLNEDLGFKLESVSSEKEEYISVIDLKDNELKNLKDILRVKMTEIQDLENKMKLVENSGTSLQSEKEAFETLLKSEREEIQSLYEQMNELVSEKLDLETIVQGKEQDLKAAKEALQALACDREKLETVLSEKEEFQLELETLSRDLSTLRERLGQRDSEKEVLLYNLQQKENDIVSIQEQLQVSVAEKEKLTVKLNSLNDDLISSDEKVEVLSKELETKKEAASKLKDMCFEKDHLMLSLKETISTVSDEIKSLKHQKEQVYEELIFYKEKYHQESNKNHSIEAKLGNLSDKCNQLEINVTEKDNTLISKAEEIGLLHRRITSLEELLNRCQQYASHQPQQIVEENVIKLQTAYVQGVESSIAKEHQYAVVPDISSMESQVMRTEDPMQLMGMQTAEEPRQTDQVQTQELKAAEQGLNKEVGELRNKLSQKDEEIERLNAMIGLKTDSYNTLDRKLHEKDEKIAFLLENMQEMEERLSQLSNSEETDVSQSEMDKKEEEIQHLTQLVEEKEFKFTKALATAKKLKQQLNQVSAALEQEKVEKQSLEQQLKHAQEEFAVVQQELKVLTEVKGGQQIQIAEEASLHKKAELQLAELQSQLTTYVEFCQQLQGQVHSLTEQVHSSEAQLKHVEDQKQYLLGEKQAIEQILTEKEEYLKEDRTEIEDLKLSLKKQQTMLAEKEKMNALIQQELDAAVKSQIDEAKNQEEILQMQEEVKHFQKKASELETKVEELEDLVTSKDSTIKEKQGTIDELEQQCCGYQSTVQLLQSEMKATVEQINTLTHNIEEEKAERNYSQSECDGFKLRIEELESQLKIQMEKYADTDKYFEEYEVRVNQFSDENAALQMQLSQKDSDFRNSLENKDSQIELLSNEITSKVSKLQELETVICQFNIDKEEWNHKIILINKTLEENEERVRSYCSLLDEKDQSMQLLTDSNDRLKEQVNNVETNNASLKDSLKILQADVEILQEDQSKLTVLQNKIVELESVIARMIEEKDTLTKEKEGLLQKHKSTETQLAVRDEEFEKVRVENEEFRTVSEKLENELVNTKQKMNILQQDEEEKCSKIQTLCGEIDVLKLQLADFESWKQEVQLRATTAEAEMDSKVYTLTLEVSAAKENIEKHLQIEHELNQQIELTKEQMHCLAEEKTKLIEDLNYSLMEVESLNAKVETGKQEKDCLLKDLEEKISNERLFNDRLADLTGKVIEINERNAELSALIDKKTAENTELMNELDNLKIIISETEDSLKKLYSEHGLQKTEYENLMIEFENLKGSLDSSLEANQVLQEELQVLKSAQVTETVERPSELIVEHIPIEQTQLLEQSENEQILEEFQADTTQPLTATLTVEGANSEKLKQELEELKQSFLDLSEEYKDTTNKLITSEAKSDKMLKKLRTFKEKNDSLQMEISTLNEQISSANSVISINKKQMDDLHNQIGVWQERHMNEEGQHHRSKVENKALKSELNERDNQIQELKLQVSAQLDEKKQIELSLNNEKYDMEKQLQMLKLQDEEISKQNKDIQEEVERLRKSLSQIEKSRQEYHLKCDDLQMSVSTLESQISVNCKEISDLKEENKLLTEKYSSSSILQDDLMQKKEAAQRQAADMKEQYQMLEQDNKNFQDLIEKTSSTNNDLKNENIQQKMVIEKLQDDIKGIEDNKQSMKKLEMAFKELESEKFNLEEEMEDLRKDVLSLKKQNKTVEDEAIALKHEVLSLRSENQSCTKTINGLNWKIDELKASGIEFENLQKSSDQLTKVIKDLENENEKLRNELSELDSRNKELQDTWRSVTEKESGILQELETCKESLQELKSIKTELSKFKLECETLKSEKVSLLAAVENEKAASNSVKKQLDKVNKKLQAFDMLKDEYEFINNEYNKLLNDNSELSKQIEELHSRLKEITTGKENTDMNQIQKEHFDRERSNLLKRVEHLESQCQELRSKNSELTENEAKLLHDFQEIEFERDRLIAREETSIHRTEDKLGRFQGDYDRLQQQFTTVMQQKNKIQMDLNLAQRGLNQRETRCQQLALQVSQLAEDRSYLNVQMAALSKALREKEQEASVVAQQYRTLYQAYVTLKATIVELERQTVTDMMYGTSTTTPNTSTPTVSTPTTSRGHSPAIGAARRLDSTDSVPRHLSNHDLEKVLKLTQQEQMLHEQDMSAYRLGLEDKEEEPGRVKVRPVLTRRGRGYLDRLQRLMSLQRSVPPVTAPE